MCTPSRATHEIKLDFKRNKMEGHEDEKEKKWISKNMRMNVHKTNISLFHKTAFLCGAGSFISLAADAGGSKTVLFNFFPSSSSFHFTPQLFSYSCSLEQILLQLLLFLLLLFQCNSWQNKLLRDILKLQRTDRIQNRNNSHL